MQIRLLSAGLGTGAQLRRYQFSYQDLQTTSGAGAKNFALETYPANSLVLGVRMKHGTAFAGGALSAMTVSVGKSGTVTFFAGAFDVFQAVGTTTVQETALLKFGQTAALAVTATFTPTGDTCANCTAGAVDIDVLVFAVSTP